MASVDYRSLAGDILTQVGGEANVASLTHCATRLRFKIKDPGKVNKKALEQIPGVIAVMEAGGQIQVVIGNNVPLAYAEFGKISRLIDDDAVEEATKGNLFNRFVAMISSIFLPFLWTLAGAALLKAFVGAFAYFGLLDATSNSYAVLNATGDAVLKFLPVMLAITAAKRFKANQFTAVVLAGALMYLEITAWTGLKASPTDFFGIPIVTVSYVGSVIPIIVAVWLQGHLERWLNKVLPSVVRNFSTPLITLLVMVPLTILTVGPATTYVGKGISWVIMTIWTYVPWLAGALMGGFWQVFVIFGVHWAFVPIMMVDLQNQGYSVISGALLAPVLAQAAAATAVFFRSKSLKRRELAGPGAVSGFLAGITEPIIYGVNLPLKRPFIFGCVGGAVGGAIGAQAGSAMTGFAMPSMLAIPTYLPQGPITFTSFVWQMIGTGLAIVIAFVLTFAFGVKDEPDAEGAPGAAVSGAIEVAAPVSGEVVALNQIKDKVFAAGALGNGLGIIPTSDQIYAPIAGTVVSAFPTSHAYGIKSTDGVEALVHIGIDTVQLNGKGFTGAVTQGQQVAAGDLLATVDFDAITAAGYDPTTVVVITNTGEFAAVMPAEKSSVSRGDVAILIER
jgi:PTS system beta-glucosides-specific IIC component